MSKGSGLLKFLNLDNLVDSFSDFVEKRLELMKLEMKEDAARVASKIILLILVLGMLFMILLFLSILLGSYLNAVMDSNYLGFGFVVLLYILLLTVLLLLKSKFRLEARIQAYIEKLLSK